MNKTAPNHIRKYCIEDMQDSSFLELQEKYEDTYSYVYKIRCSCGNSHFAVYHDIHPSIFCECTKCKNYITVYDLKYYPAAIKLNDDFEIQRLVIENDSEFYVYVAYEYSNEFEDSGDVEFDADDITWALAFVKGEHCFEMILNDETA